MNDEAGLVSDMSAAYASGRLPGPLRLLVDTYAAMDAAAARARADAEAVGGALLERLAPAAMSETALDDALKAIDALGEDDDARHAAAARQAGAALEELLALPEPLRSFALSSAEHGGWRFAGPGVRVMPLTRDGASKAELIRIEAGHGAPAHGHEGDEYTLVLTGAFRERENVFSPGDLCVAGPEVTHRPIAEPGATCIALAVTDAPLAFTGVLGLMQRVFRIH